MPETEIAHPKIVDRETWLKERKAFLAREKDMTRAIDKLSADRRRLPMVKVESTYTFEGPDGQMTLADLFDGQTQLIVYHFMFGPDDEKGCPGCTGFIDSVGEVESLGKRNSRFILISRGPLAKLERYKAQRGWTIPWYSSFGGDFNYDYHVTRDPDRPNQEYNYQPLGDDQSKSGETHGLSVFFRLGDDVYHTYSTYARGVESLVHTYAMLDVTPYGRQEDWEDSPNGFPQNPTYG